MRTPSPLDNVLQTPHSMSSGLPAVPLTETSLSAGGHMTAGGIPAAGSLTMMQRLQMDRRRQLEEYKARQQQEGMCVCLMSACQVCHSRIYIQMSN